MAFSTASEPEQANKVFLGKSPGVTLFSNSARSRYGSIVVTSVQVWMYLSNCFFIAATTFSLLCPTLIMPIPPAKSSNWFPSTSHTKAPSALSTTTSVDLANPAGNKFFLLSKAARPFGPGRLVFNLIDVMILFYIF